MHFAPDRKKGDILLFDLQFVLETDRLTVAAGLERQAGATHSSVSLIFLLVRFSLSEIA